MKSFKVLEQLEVVFQIKSVTAHLPFGQYPAVFQINPHLQRLSELPLVLQHQSQDYDLDRGLHPSVTKQPNLKGG